MKIMLHNITLPAVNKYNLHRLVVINNTYTIFYNSKERNVIYQHRSGYTDYIVERSCHDAITVPI